MNEDDEICLCFHVTRRKLVKFVRIERPQRESQMSQCQGAGTGCGWCRPFLKEIFRMETGQEQDSDLSLTMTQSEYATLREKYRSDQNDLID